jgi:hypothetical protein
MRPNKEGRFSGMGQTWRHVRPGKGRFSGREQAAMARHAARQGDRGCGERQHAAGQGAHGRSRGTTRFGLKEEGKGTREERGLAMGGLRGAGRRLGTQVVGGGVPRQGVRRGGWAVMRSLVRSVSVRAQKYGGDSHQPIGSMTRGEATKGVPHRAA